MTATDGSNLAALFAEHRHGLAAAVRGILGNRADVAEVLQESFLRAWRARDRLDREPVGFVYVVTLNLARDLRRRSAGRDPLDLEEVPTVKLSSNDPPPHAAAEQDEAVAAARAAITRLDDAEKDVFFLRVSGGLTFTAVAESLGIPIGTAKTRMRSALAELRTSLRSHAPTYESGRENR